MAFHVTRCPGCESTFNTNPALLMAAAGRVRCGACLKVFEAEANFVADDYAGDEPDSVFVGNQPEDYFDPSSFLTRRSLQEPTPAPAAVPETEVVAPAPTQEPEEPIVAWGMGSEPEAGPEFQYPDEEDQAGLQPQAAMGETGDFFSAVEQGLNHGDSEPDFVIEPAMAEMEPDPTMFAHDDAALPDYSVELAPEYETDSSAAIRQAQEEFISVSQPPLQSLDENSQQDIVDVAVEESTTAVPDNVAEEESTEAIRARALQARFEDEDGLEAISEESRSALGKVANTLELPLGRQRRWGRGLGLGALSLVLGAALAGQYLWRYLPLYSLDARLRPLYQLACEYIACELPVYRDINSIRSEGLVVRSHPELDNALIANISFQNTAAFPQPFPILILSFNSASNSVVALREFSPQEYLPSQLQSLQLMPSQQPVQLSLELIDPGADAVNYTLAFRRP